MLPQWSGYGLMICRSSGALRFPGKKYAIHHLHACSGGVTTHADLDLDLPMELVHYADVFGEKEANQLPPHQSYDCPIDLVPNAKLPVGRIYSVRTGVGSTVGLYREESLEGVYLAFYLPIGCAGALYQEVVAGAAPVL